MPGMVYMMTNREVTEQFAYVSNTLSGTIAVYHIDRNGTLSHLQNVASMPIDASTGFQ